MSASSAGLSRQKERINENRSTWTWLRSAMLNLERVPHSEPWIRVAHTRYFADQDFLFPQRIL